MNKTAGLLLLLTVAFSTSRAGEIMQSVATDRSTLEQPAINMYRIESSYVFESSLENDGSYGDQDALQTVLEYSHRFHLSGNLYVRAGLAYERFDFGNTFAPVPVHLQSMAGIIGIDYMHGKDIGAFIQLRPGFYTEEHLGIASFDMPITLGRVFVLQEDRLFLFVGATAAFLRGEYPVLPIVGIVWRPNERWNVYGVLPEPRVVYSANKALDIWAGGQLVGSSFRTDHDDNIAPRKLSGAQVDYTEYRAGLGVDMHCGSAVSLGVSGGYVFQRRFNFERAGEDFESDPAPYLRVALKGEF
ncbi:MAG: hypothetical protein H0U43_06225 [Chthoniobacterales bacterium]|nr:hypothetical protein [Chthoniobacterales bacterium]